MESWVILFHIFSTYIIADYYQVLPEWTFVYKGKTINKKKSIFFTTINVFCHHLTFFPWNAETTVYTMCYVFMT